MLANDDIQAALVAYLKAKTAVTSLLVTSAGVKESQWQGTQFDYPAVRLDLGVQTPVGGGSGSCPARLTISIRCYSQNASSQEADNLAGAVNSVLHGKQFSNSGIRFVVYSTGLVSAVRQDERTWRSEANFWMIVQ